MTKEEYNKKQEKILKELEAIQKMQNYLGDARERLQSLYRSQNEDLHFPEVEDTIYSLADRTHFLIEGWRQLEEKFRSDQKRLDKDDEK